MKLKALLLLGLFVATGGFSQCFPATPTNPGSYYCSDCDAYGWVVKCAGTTGGGCSLHSSLNNLNNSLDEKLHDGISLALAAKLSEQGNCAAAATRRFNDGLSVGLLSSRC
jgi:hypothetical protein